MGSCSIAKEAYATLGKIADGTGKRVKVSCDRCDAQREMRPADIDALIAKKGRTYSLIGRRSRCKLTAGCKGWNRWHYWNACWWPLWDEEDAERWLLRRTPN